jgi:hypothetical protein
LKAVTGPIIPKRSLSRSKEHLPLVTAYTSTLLELVLTVSEFATTEEEILATVTHRINSGKVQLASTFAGARIDMATRMHTAPTLVMDTDGACQAGALSTE